MAFYQDISKYYDYIFPAGEEQLEFLRKEAGKPPKALLDIACGTGGYSIPLAREGYDMTAADIDAAMVQAVEQKLGGSNTGVKSIKAGMLDLAEKLNNRFDLAFCIGNSVVHLDNAAEIQQFFKTAKSLLKTGGEFVIQIINFDRVLHKQVTELPELTNPEAGLAFKRYYRYDPTANKIFFRTILTVKEGTFENEIPLFPLLSEEAANMLKIAGFEKVELFGDFTGKSYDRENSFMLVIKAY